MSTPIVIDQQEPTPTDISTTSEEPKANDAVPDAPAFNHRRIGRVERWLRKGYGFVIDMGCLDSADDTRYGWTRDSISGQKIFVYHNALKSQSQNVFHRLFTNEYIEYQVDPSRPRKNGRLQAFEVSGMNGSELLCDLNAAAALESEQQHPQQQQQQQQQPRQRHQQRGAIPQQQQQQQPLQPPANATVQYIYYVPAPAPNDGGPPAPSSFPPLSHTVASSEPSYVMPSSGIPVPK
jgi:hypothetical protein